MSRFDLTDAHYLLLTPYLPPDGQVCHPWGDHRRILNGLFWKQRTGAPWRDIPERYGPWQAICDRFVWWRRNGTWDRMLRALQIELDARGYLDWDQWNLDGTNIRAAVLLRVRALMAGMRMTRPITRWVGRSAAWARKCIW